MLLQTAPQRIKLLSPQICTLATLKIKCSLNLCTLLKSIMSESVQMCFQLNNSTQDKTLSLDLE